MALDLFVNFERSSNSSLFYRVTSSTPASFTVKLSNLELPDEDLSSTFFAQSALNNGPFGDFNFNGIMNLDTSSPCVCSISVNVSSGGEFFNSYSLSGIFIKRIPSANFLAYPSFYINESNGQKVALNSSNYSTSPGVYFYGEGHTEVINLSASGLASGDVSNWFIGNALGNIAEGTTNLTVLTATASTASVSVSTVPSDESSYPISLRVTNSSIALNGPLVTYDDATGVRQFYPFFSSTLNANGEEVRQTLKGNVKVLQYPEANPSAFQSPFADSLFTLPLDYSLQTFRGIITNPTLSGILTESFAGSQWELLAAAEVGEWSVMTDFLSSVLAYQFQLSYDQTASEVSLPYYKTSPAVPTTVSLSVSSFKSVSINLAPFDWIPKLVPSQHTASATVGPLPFAKLYTPNYYNLKNQDVTFEVVAVPAAPLEIERLTIQSPHSSQTLVLTGSPVPYGTKGTMQFNKIGVVDLSATAVLRNTITSAEQQTTIILADIIEIVNSYDDEPIEDYFKTALTPLKLTYDFQPRLTPNEWAIADNVNSIIEKIYTTVDDLDDYTRLYEKKDKFYGWVGPKQSKYVWMDLECPTNSEDVATWAQFECATPSPLITWEYHECDTSQSDPTCLQKYCLEWKWKSRKCGVSDVNVTWKSAKCGAEYAKKWLFEKCETDSESLNCDRDSWKISTIDPLFFPIPSCDSVSRCAIIDCEVNSQTDQLVIAYPTEINLIDKDYNTTFVARRGVADELFAFQNIVGLTINFEGKVIVLDSILARVSVFKITDNAFKLFSNWGSYGLASNPQGFNKPRDIHVDASNSVWIADTGNKCIKKLTIIGKHLLTITHEKLDASAPLSVCVDSNLNVHCLTETKVIVFDQHGNYSFEYIFPEEVTGVKKINTSYNKEMVYITFTNGIIKYFRNGTISHYTLLDLECADKQIVQGYNSLSQDKYRNVYVTVNDRILKIPDLQKIVEQKAALPKDLYWSLSDLLVHKEEYIQPWVYLKSFHRLWDNIELLRSSLFYDLEGCKSYVSPTFMKTDLVIGQNEIVTNAVINRLSEQLWTNLQSLIKYFDPNCGKFDIFR